MGALVFETEVRKVGDGRGLVYRTTAHTVSADNELEPVGFVEALFVGSGLSDSSDLLELADSESGDAFAAAEWAVEAITKGQLEPSTGLLLFSASSYKESLKEYEKATVNELIEIALVGRPLVSVVAHGGFHCLELRDLNFQSWSVDSLTRHLDPLVNQNEIHYMTC